MGIPSTERYAAMLDAAAAGGYAYPAINVTSSQALNAAIRGFAEADSDGIVEMTAGAAQYLAGASGDAVRGARALAAFARRGGARIPGNDRAPHRPLSARAGGRVPTATPGR
jgi:fructose-bisphosphate aldolase class II